MFGWVILCSTRPSLVIKSDRFHLLERIVWDFQHGTFLGVKPRTEESRKYKLFFIRKILTHAVA